MDAASIEEINKLRKSMGMKPLPVPGADTSNQDQKSAATDKDEEAASTLETREARAYDNYRKVREAEETRRKRDEKALAVKKAREKAQRSAVLGGKGLADLNDGAELDTKSWLKEQKKRQKAIAKARKLEEEKAAEEAAAAAAIQYTSKDLAGVKVGHDVSDFLDGDEQVLTLKDANVLDEEEGEDELENQNILEREQLKERLELKKKKPVYDPTDIDETGERGILSHYDEEIDGKKKKLFKLDARGATSDVADILNAPVAKRGGVWNFDDDKIGENIPTTSDYLDISEIKVKKPKKRKSKTTRKRPSDDDDVLAPLDEPTNAGGQAMEVDSVAASMPKKRRTEGDSFVDDDEDLQTSLALQRKDALKKRKRTRPEDIARRLREEASQEPGSVDGEGANGAGGGIVLDEITGFVDTLQKSGDREERKRPSKQKVAEEAVTAMDQESSDEDEDMKDAPEVKQESPEREVANLTTTGVEEEESISQGMGSTLKLLRDRGLIGDGQGDRINEQYRSKQLFLAELNRRMAQFDEDTRLQRERDRTSGRLDRMSAREREDWQRQQNTSRDQHQSRVMDQLYREGYKPAVELKYFDEHGRSLDQKEAFKHLSHQFHGKGSGKGKTDKRLKKIQDEKRRESQSMLDASQNVGMSSAAAQQLKKRREAGVRMA